jgi:hypothetical protein
MTPDVLDDAGPAPGRGADPAAEPLTLDVDPDVVDQAVVDAEFVAMILTERPWGEPQAASRPTPPAVVTRTRRDRPPRGSGPRSEQRIRLLPTVGATPQVRRRTGPGPRSPPPSRNLHRAR